MIWSFEAINSNFERGTLHELPRVRCRLIATLEPRSWLDRPVREGGYSMERWLPVVGYEGLYEVSDLGRIRSLDRKVIRPNGQVHSLRGKIRLTFDNGHGYPALVLYRNGVKECLKVHTLVATAFLGPRPSDKEVAHWDGDRSNPKLKNLRYATPKENQSDQERHGTRACGEKHGASKLTDSDVMAIRSRLASGERSCDLSEEFGVSRSNIAEIKSRRTWGHL